MSFVVVVSGKEVRTFQFKQNFSDGCVWGYPRTTEEELAFALPHVFCGAQMQYAYTTAKATRESLSNLPYPPSLSPLNVVLDAQFHYSILIRETKPLTVVFVLQHFATTTYDPLCSGHHHPQLPPTDRHSADGVSSTLKIPLSKPERHDLTSTYGRKLPLQNQAHTHWPFTKFVCGAFVMRVV